MERILEEINIGFTARVVEVSQMPMDTSRVGRPNKRTHTKSGALGGYIKHFQR
jgi:diphthamide synthase (EF-2-diphthine--ammonia ligase)